MQNYPNNLRREKLFYTTFERMSNHIAYILTGSNEGNRYDHLKKALSFIEATGSELLNVSTIYETAAWGPIRQTAFLNQVLVISTSLNPETLMLKLLDIEQQMGRIREQKMGPRIIDIDILFYDNIVYQTDDLIIPHPLLHERRFVLFPLCQINADLFHPVLLKTVKTLLKECKDTLEVKEWQIS
jgi:2-amino-4-hydroxy-6-hydroxymethyldihydropteridine diphosphokinase